jgi:hypothetical protein
MTEALRAFTENAVMDEHTHRVSVDEWVLSKARAALSTRSEGQVTEAARRVVELATNEGVATGDNGRNLWGAAIRELAAALSSTTRVGADEEAAVERDARELGIGIMKDGKRVDPADFYAAPDEDAELVEWLRARAARIRREIGGSSTADRLDRIAERISSRDDGLLETAREIYATGYRNGFADAHVDESGPADEEAILAKLDNVALVEGWDANVDTFASSLGQSHIRGRAALGARE